MLFILIFCSALSFVFCAVLIRSGRRTANRYGLDVPQRFHAGHVPRLGGLAMLASCSLGWLWMVVAGPHFGVANGIRLPTPEALGWSIAALIAAAGGAVEDIWHVLRARWRLAITLLAALAAAYFLGLRIDRLGFPALDSTWRSLPWAVLGLTVLALAGLPHAFNLIDGYNGLAGAVAMICCFALAYVALQVGDREIAGVVLVMAGATAGFMVWNYPRGLIFAGDGGAYLWGVVIAASSILLTQRHPQVSPWFPLLLLSYPVLETVFSSYRKLVRGQSPSMADALHFHQLIYRRIVCGVFDDDEARRMLMRNNRTSPYLWGFSMFTVVPAALFWKNTPVLIGSCMLFVAAYLYAYKSIVRFRVPRWLKSR